MNVEDALLDLAAKTGIFLLKIAGGAGIGIGIGIASSYLVKHPGRIDTFALVESTLGIVITGLAVVGAFIVAFQWSNLDSRIQEHSKEAKEYYNNLKALLEKTASITVSYEQVTADISKLMVDSREVLKNTEEIQQSSRKVFEDIIEQYEKWDNKAKDIEIFMNEIQHARKNLENEQNVSTDTLNETKKGEPTTKQNELAEGEDG